MLPMSTPDEGGHNSQSSRNARKSIFPQSTSAERTKIERLTNIIRPYIVAAITTAIEQIQTLSQDNGTPEEGIRKVKKKAKRDKGSRKRKLEERKKQADCATQGSGRSKSRKNQGNRTAGKKAKTYQEISSRCEKCNKNHSEEYTIKVCYNCKRKEYMIKDCGIPSERKRDREDLEHRNSEKKARVYQGTSPWCAKCDLHHHGECNVCSKCKLPSHVTRNCKKPETRKCFECGGRDHIRNTCPKLGRDKKNSKETFKIYQRTNPWCPKCEGHYQGKCRTNVCSKCKFLGHLAKDCKTPKVKVCYECRSVNHLRDKCPELGRG